VSYVAIPRMPWPDPFQFRTQTISANITGVSLLLDASGEKIAILFRAPRAGVLEKVHFLTGTVTTGDTVRVSFQDPSTTDDVPDETQDQFRDVTIADGDDNAWKSTGLITSDGSDVGSKRTVAKAEMLAIVFEFPSYVAGNLNLDFFLTGTDFSFCGSCWATHKTGGTWTTQRTVVPNFILEYSGGIYYQVTGSLPWSSVLTVSFDLDTTPDEIGVRFLAPISGRIGAGFGAIDVGTIDHAVVLYDAADVELASLTVDKDQVGINTVDSRNVWEFPAFAAVRRGELYRLVYKGLAAGTDSELHFAALPSNAFLAAAPGGIGFYRTERTGGGGWTDTNVQYCTLGVYYDEVEIGAPRAEMILGVM